MLLLFPSDPFDPRKPDEAWKVEIEAAQATGFEVAYIHWESLVNDQDPDAAVRHVPEAPPAEAVEEDGGIRVYGSDAMYRGWMLRPIDYDRLFCALNENKNYMMVTHPDQYQEAHQLPNWYKLPEIAAITPRSVVVPLSTEGFFEKAIEEATALFKNCSDGIIVKDYVKSRKHEWKEACFIADPESIPKVVATFLERQGEDLQGGLVFREYIKLLPIGTHPQSGMPMSLEYRVFVFEGDVFMLPIPYWSEGRYPDMRRLEPPLNLDRETLDAVHSPFYSLDVAMSQEGRWVLLEIGDGQVSGLPDLKYARAFYEGLAKATG